MKAMKPIEIENLIKQVNSEIGSDYSLHNPSIFTYSTLCITSGNGVRVELHTDDAHFLDGYYANGIQDLHYCLVDSYKKAETRRKRNETIRNKAIAREQDVISELRDGEIAIRIYEVARETDKASLVKIFKGDNGTWLPKSQVRLVNDEYLAIADWLGGKLPITDIIEKFLR